LSIIPIPVAEPDPDVNLNLGEVFAQTYDDAPYADCIDYSAPLESPLTPEDRAWAEEIGRAQAQPPSRET
jgi:hypothetical protein